MPEATSENLPSAASVPAERPRTTEEFKSFLHGLRIRRGKDDQAFQNRATILISGLDVLMEPQGRHGQHKAQLAAMRQAARELDEMTGGAHPWLLEWRPRRTAAEQPHLLEAPAVPMKGEAE